jgi:hypothetical protein
MGSYKDLLFGKKDHGGGLLDKLHRKRIEDGEGGGNRTILRTPLRALDEWAEGTQADEEGEKVKKGYRATHPETTPIAGTWTDGTHYR